MESGSPTSSDYDGDEQWDIFLVSSQDRQGCDLTSTREIAELNPTWSPDGRYLAYEVKPKTSAAYEIDIYDTLMREVKHLTTNTPQDKSNSEPIWSKDGKYIVYTQEQAKGTDSNIFVADVATGQSTLLHAASGRPALHRQRHFTGWQAHSIYFKCGEWL